MAEAFAWAYPSPMGLAALVLGYLLGSIPFGIILTRLSGGPDLRTIGSGNIGATNVLRTGNKKLAALTLLGDMLKGTAAVLLAGWMLGGKGAALAAGLGAFLGHLFPVWLRFKGGKGVATFLGILIGLKLYYLPNKADIQVGDTIRTSGIGGFFPKGLYAGTVLSVNEDGKGNYDAIVSLDVDFLHIENALIVVGVDEAVE